MKADHYFNLQKLVIFVETILSPVKLKKANVLINDFVQELAGLYTPRIMLSGVHELLHMVDETLAYGPLNNINCFQFEELNRKMLRFIHGFDLIGEEMIKVFSTAQYLSHAYLDLKSYGLKLFVASRLKLKSSRFIVLCLKNKIKARNRFK